MSKRRRYPMSEVRHKFAVVFLAVVVGILVGALLTEILTFILPTGVVKTFFMKEVGFGFDPVHIDLALLEFTFGFTFHFNFIAIIAVALTVYYFKWWL
ncbi:hypothetical protein DRQ36_01105 [bacterium]|nr:MAG: hypothetical protein DRQ36_01105 [bacterium]